MVKSEMWLREKEREKLLCDGKGGANASCCSRPLPW
jgi:hypothetical protein